MRPFLFTAILLAMTVDSFSQENMLQSTCNCFERLTESNLDKIDFQLDHERCYSEIYTKAISLKHKDSSETVVTNFLEQLRSHCDPYIKAKAILDKMTLEKSEIKIKNKKACKQMMLVGDFEDNSGTERVIMSMRDSIQLMTFGNDRLYTKSKIKWIDDCSYKAIFVESTNPFENAYLKKGDEREIRIIDIKNKEVIYEVSMFGRWLVGKVTKIK